MFFSKTITRFIDKRVSDAIKNDLDNIINKKLSHENIHFINEVEETVRLVASTSVHMALQDRLSEFDSRIDTTKRDLQGEFESIKNEFDTLKNDALEAVILKLYKKYIK